MRFDVVDATNRYQAASQHMQGQTVSMDKILVIGGLILLIVAIILFSKMKK